jgi:DeoR family myo-inositol catabolism operon transcriptional repressor
MKTERISAIENYIYENKTVTLDALCEKFNVSKNTIRRDLDALSSNGSIQKIYGGATVHQRKELVSYHERSIRNLTEKRKIASMASTFVNDGDIIFIDSGTTTSRMFDYIADKHLTILTNNLEFINQAIPYENIEIITLSGQLNRKALSFAGETAASVLAQYNISKAFMASAGISLQGATNSSMSEYVVKRTAIERSQKVYLMADSSKFDVVSLMTYCTLDEIDALISDTCPPKDISDYILKSKKDIMY